MDEPGEARPVRAPRTGVPDNRGSGTLAEDAPSLEVGTVAVALGSDPDLGLPTDRAALLLAEVGPNSSSSSSVRGRGGSSPASSPTP